MNKYIKQSNDLLGNFPKVTEKPIKNQQKQTSHQT